MEFTEYPSLETKSIYQIIEENWKTIRQSLISRNVMSPEIEAMGIAYSDSVLKRHFRDSIQR